MLLLQVRVRDQVLVVMSERPLAARLQVARLELGGVRLLVLPSSPFLLIRCWIVLDGYTVDHVSTLALEDVLRRNPRGQLAPLLGLLSIEVLLHGTAVAAFRQELRLDWLRSGAATLEVG